MSKEEVHLTQLSLFDTMGSGSSGTATPVSPPVDEAATSTQEPQPIHNRNPRRREMTLKEMCDLRAWLFTWGKEHGYPAFSFAIGDGVMGDYRTGAMLGGELHWTNALRCQDMDWVIKAVEWIQAGKIQEQASP